MTCTAPTSPQTSRPPRFMVPAHRARARRAIGATDNTTSEESVGCVNLMFSSFYRENPTAPTVGDFDRCGSFASTINGLSDNHNVFTLFGEHTRTQPRARMRADVILRARARLCARIHFHLPLYLRDKYKKEHGKSALTVELSTVRTVVLVPQVIEIAQSGSNAFSNASADPINYPEAGA
jgi:hypothetical protein